MNEVNTQSYWDTRWIQGQTGWDVGYPTPPITNYIDKWNDKDAAILIPGCGNAYEATYLVDQGFNNIHLIDISAAAVERLKQKFESTSIQVIFGDFFDHKGQYDLILEQTFFCALPPELRNNYAIKMHQLLKTNGIIAGVLFNTNFEQAGPPFGGTIEEYKRLFDPLYHIHKLEPCTNSIGPRAGNEVFIELQKK